MFEKFFHEVTGPYIWGLILLLSLRAIFSSVRKKDYPHAAAFSGKECAFHGGVECFCINGDRAVLGIEPHGKFLGGRAGHGKVEEQVQGMHTVLQCPLRPNSADFFTSQIVGGSQDAVRADVLVICICFCGF